LNTLLANLKKISCFVFDVDGVLTNGEVIVMPDGILVRKMNIKDGYAMQLAIKKGFPVWVISGGNSSEVEERLQRLGITEVHMRVKDKKALLQELASMHNIPLDEILFMGDDMPDLEAMKMVGVAACPNDAAVDIKQIANYISAINGGAGCARDVIEKVLKLNNQWDTNDAIRAQ
jgi:3-deoxy-D-manno-octulosonate 8-phosphate phosphatase (KDO 8-P phosphatase)